MGQALAENIVIGAPGHGIGKSEAANDQHATVDIRNEESFILPSGIDANPFLSHHSRMPEPLTRPELDAKLETIEAKMEGRLARIDDRFDRLDSTIAELRTSMQGALQSTKNAVWYAAATVIATFVAVVAVYIAAFDSGRETAVMASKAQQETAAALSEIRQIVSDLKQQAPTSQ